MTYGLVRGMTPAEAMAFIEDIRDEALHAAWPDGVEIPACRVQVGDQILSPHGWEEVDGVEVDGWAGPFSDDAVSIATTRHEQADDAYPFRLSTPVKVRRGEILPA
ncbi:hypothetical protein AB0B39_23760 [Micromonospora sp. NPDC049114]|uniref:hypothetical protein n=1 Tax=Micromonospora sp. NPDC049114 TaxID=3155498 RepID=UPI0033EC7902